MPDATGLELLARELGDAALETVYFRDGATIEIDPSQIRTTLQAMRAKGYAFLASVHGVDYYPDEPRLGVLYELLDMGRVDRLTIKLRVSSQRPRVESVAREWPTANHQEREVFDMFGVVFEGHPDLRRILMPEDYEGHPQRRDFPMGGEPVIFTRDEAKWLEAREGEPKPEPDEGMDSAPSERALLSEHAALKAQPGR
ncbi:MAG TPA: NADH-quinone oxidoreductase subunit C [Solirubrobacteraceae bacterium]|nr:NADH-quinone oxidoreductase subunit C [Solirubrobacteraceae bacterium]